VHDATASSPEQTATGADQPPTTSPAAIPAGTQPAAIAPAAAPRKNGVASDHAANAAPKTRCSPAETTALRKANADPRAMIPRAARVSGIHSVEAIAANTAG